MLLAARCLSNNTRNANDNLAATQMAENINGERDEGEVCICIQTRRAAAEKEGEREWKTQENVQLLCKKGKREEKVLPLQTPDN